MAKGKKWGTMLVALTLVGALFAGCSSSNSNNNSSAGGSTTSEPKETATATDQPVDGGTFTFSSSSDIVTVNPLFVSDTASGDASYFLYANLYDLDREGNVAVEPWSLAAELPQISEDGKTYTIKLKDTPKWSDGQPVTADDVVYTINTIKNPETGAPGISSYDKVKDVAKVDDHTVKITLSQVYAPFQYTLASSVVPAHVLKDIAPKDLQANAYGTDPAKTVTNGPWKWTEWKQKQYLTFEADSSYWGATKPHIAKVVYKIYADQNTEVQALLKGDVDSVQAIPVTQVEAVKKKDGITVSQKPGPQYEYLGFNFKKENFPGNYSLFEGEKTRQAIAYAINREGIVNNVLKGTGAPLNAPFLPGTWADPGENATSYDFNVEKAKELLKEDGWADSDGDGIVEKDGHKFSFELQYNSGNSRREQVSSIIQSNLKDIGIEVKTRAIDFSAWVDQNLNPGKYQAILLAWSLNTPDPDGESIFSSKYYPPAGQNQGFYNNPTLDKLWVEGYSTVDQDKRKEIYNQVAKQISTNLPYVFLYQYGTPQGVGPKVKFTDADKPEPSLAYGYFFHIINWWTTK
ncbi:ABC transporter substrate-binding protein [Paenibacillus sp. JX-17]|uniref:ABC transporter substrate-binding protein n=1 Tax=Paenibacillus lacisoli TaxID=3064525 RepID=A0ABT9CDX5_9BACL|nr:ABC transporter substrate-binding protein [Paenibacillus sp. JX-17]MDO7906177.1 ABC transporter substrate-binding protein [Paenibacillus sp. JX-17]